MTTSLQRICMDEWTGAQTMCMNKQAMLCWSFHPEKNGSKAAKWIAWPKLEVNWMLQNTAGAGTPFIYLIYTLFLRVDPELSNDDGDDDDSSYHHHRHHNTINQYQHKTESPTFDVKYFTFLHFSSRLYLSGTKIQTKTTWSNQRRVHTLKSADHWLKTAVPVT